MKLRTILLLAPLLIASCASAPDEAAQAAIDSFDEAWRLIHESYWDPGMGGLDWEGIRDELRPALVAKPSLEASRRAIRAMLARLGQSHFALIPRSEPAKTAGATGALHSTGIALAFSSEGLLVSGIETGSAASRAGIVPGSLVTRIGGFDAARLMAWARGEGGAPDGLRFMPIGNRLWVAGGDPFVIEYLDVSGNAALAELFPEPYAGDLATLISFAAGPVEFEARALEGGIGYLRLSMFADPVRIMAEFEVAIARFAQAPGIVLDLRGNPGGYGAMASNMGGFFVAERAYLGTQRMREGTVKYVLQPRKNSYLGPLAILIDAGSASTSEILASGLQALGRARVFGERSMGAALPSTFKTLPSGDILQYAVADYVSANGERLEGFGVEPDVEVLPTRAALVAGVDVALESALEWIKEMAPPENGAPMQH